MRFPEQKRLRDASLWPRAGAKHGTSGTTKTNASCKEINSETSVTVANSPSFYHQKSSEFHCSCSLIRHQRLRELGKASGSRPLTKGNSRLNQQLTAPGCRTVSAPPD